MMDAPANFPRLKSVSDLATTLNSISSTRHVVLDGENLSAADLIAISRVGTLPPTKVSVSDAQPARTRMEDSKASLEANLDNGETVYGVNTGYGGSANTRTREQESLQYSLLHFLRVGISDPAAPDQDLLPEPVVRAAMAIRINSLVRGHSAVSRDLVNALTAFLNLNITPCVPARGSISASGDLIPLAHLASCLVGSRDAYVFFGETGQRSRIPAHLALQQFDLKPLQMQPKEGLALVNGTSTSAAMMAVTLLDVSKISCASHVMTAMTVEALGGSARPYAELIHDVCRPHPGQCDSASTMRAILYGSQLVKEHNKAADSKPSIADVGLLAQDRYSTRTTPQWFGPQIEQLWQADRQIAIELNSTTDNPLISRGEVYNGGNFQATSVALPAETLRLSINAYARTAFSQLSEIVNVDLNNGLPANLAGGDPSVDYGCKGLEIAAASYMSEIAFLANPVTSHVQTAELHNQALNSLALISARYLAESCRVMYMLLANHLYMLSQAVTLRVATRTFAETLFGVFNSATGFDKLSSKIQFAFTSRLISASATNWSLDPPLRFEKAFEQAIGSLVGFESVSEALFLLQEARGTMRELFVTHWRTVLRTHAQDPSLTSAKMGASSALFDYVRGDLQIPFHDGHEQSRDVSHSVSQIFSALQGDQIWMRLTARMFLNKAS
ncbi:unnamed protein product [Sympodiomycopsis kandeliae]